MDYDSVFAQVSFQFCGHLDEYLIRHTRHLGLFYAQTRFGQGGHLLRLYDDGKLVEERHFPSAKSIPCYYGRMWWAWHRALKRFCRGKSAVTILFEHPLLAIGNACCCKVKDIFWQWDYFPGHSLTERLFNAVAGRNARKCACYIPLTKAIGRAMGLPAAGEVMLGIEAPRCFGDTTSSRRVLMVGQLRHGQGVEDVLDFIASHPQYSLALMGAAAGGFEKTIASKIATAHMSDRVYFPNHFVTDAELRDVAARCFVSLALYDTSPDNLTHYADPGKVKSSIEMGLPVVMTRISDIVPFIERFKAGVVIDSLCDLPAAVDRVRNNYADYQGGLRAFAEYFNYNRYYQDKLLK